MVHTGQMNEGEVNISRTIYNKAPNDVGKSREKRRGRHFEMVFSPKESPQSLEKVEIGWVLLAFWHWSFEGVLDLLVSVRVCGIVRKWVLL